MAFDGTLKFDTAIDKTGFKLGLDSLGGIAKTGMGLVTKAVGAASAAVSALGGYAVKVGEGFESSMAQVIATMGITKDTIEDGVNSYDLLKEAAAAAGESTTFSASEAADALNYLALAGYSAAQASEALPAVLDLAAAGGLDLAYASDLATDAMAALGIEATKENLTAFGDQMAKTASKANTSVSQLGEAILTVGGTAKVLAGGTTELNAALGVLANRGIKGAEGGTHLRNMILSLSAPTDTAKAALDSLGVSALDAEGNMRPLNEVFADLQKSMEGMSDGDTAAVLSDIFNKTDLAAAQAMIAGCGDEFDKLTADLENCDGAMSDMAQTMNDTLEGDMKSLGSKAEAFGIAIYDSLNDPLRELVQLGGDYVSQLTAAFNSGGFDGLAEAFGDVLGQAVTKLTGYLPELTKLGASLVSSLVKGLSDNAPALARSALDAGLTLVKGIAQAAGDAVELGAALLTAIADGITKRQTKIRITARNIIRSITKAISESLPDMLEAGTEIMTVLTEVIAENLPVLAESGMQILTVLSGAIVDNLPLLAGAGLRLLKAVGEGIRDNLPALADTALTLVEQLAEFLIENLPALVTAALELISFLCGALLDGENLSRLLDAGLQMLMAIVDTITENLPLLVDVAVQIILFLVQELLSAENIEKLLTAAVEILLTLVNAIIDNLDDVLLAAEAVVAAICEELLTPENIEKLLVAGAELLGRLVAGICQIAGKLAGFGYMMLEEIEQELQEPDWETIGWEIVEGIISGLIGTKFSLADYLDDFKENWVSGIKDVFGIHSPSKVMKDDVGKFLAMGIGEGFENSMASIGQKAVQSVTAWTSVLPKKAEEAASQFITISDSYLKQLPGMMSEQLTETVQR
ncbi:MAG: phage tail tape measure protein, partial [Oscillospiraceae bacterium]|nr:phage tail tape measure protein [Oscillospiraceae bacterium]